MLKEISTLGAELGERTLGQYLADLQTRDPHVRLRGRHTRRDMYEREFEAIWAAQQKYHPALLTEQLKYGSTGKQNYPCKPGSSPNPASATPSSRTLAGCVRTTRRRAIRLSASIRRRRNCWGIPFDQLPILADALEEAGCSDETLLGHLRATEGHIRGCWAVDAVLAKE
jgi:hypothetical protein